MIKYALVCEHEHGFEGWFGSSDDYETQHAGGQIDCPICASKAVRKAIMAPAIAGVRGARAEPSPQQVQAMMMQAAQEVRRHVEDNFDYVGDRFADEARKIHGGQAEERGIYGEATGEQIKALADEGVPIAPLPSKPPEKKDIN